MHDAISAGVAIKRFDLWGMEGDKGSQGEAVLVFRSVVFSSGAAVIHGWKGCVLGCHSRP